MAPERVPDENATPAAEEPTASPRRAVPFAMAALLLIAAVLILLEAGGYRAGSGGEPGPAALPYLVGGLSAVTAIALVIQTLRGVHLVEDDGAGGVLPIRVLVAMVVLVAAAFLFRELGFFVVFTVVSFAMGWLAGARRWWTNLIVAAVVSWLVMIVFGRLFSVPLPAGPIDVFLGG